MKLIAICGSARKQGNTAQMLHSVMQGAQSAGAETQLVNLFDLNFTDCVGCYACKLKNSTSYARCMLNDDLTPLLRRIEASDAIVLGAPVYYGNVSGQMRSFTDRLLFQYLDYGGKGQGPKPKNFKTALVATMNMNHRDCIDRGVADSLAWFSQVIGHTLGSCELLTLTNTVLFDNYTKYVYKMPDLEEKASRTEKIPPQDLQNAFHLGVRLVQG